MSLYTVTIENRTYRVNISGDHATVNGVPVNAKVVQLNHNGLHLLQRGKQAIELFLSTLEADTYQLNMLDGRRIVSRVTTRTKKQFAAEAAGALASTVCAPMHGRVVKVEVKPGDTVETGQTLIVLESMKMQMQIRSPREGKIAKVAIQPGVQVEKKSLLVQFE
jgi:pyruvate carboxylase